MLTKVSSEALSTHWELQQVCCKTYLKVSIKIWLGLYTHDEILACFSHPGSSIQQWLARLQSDNNVKSKLPTAIYKGQQYAPNANQISDLRLYYFLLLAFFLQPIFLELFHNKLILETKLLKISKRQRL